ncbi:mitochondrial aaa atpase [Pyrenophora seminiperda CCB06]|uniref:Mitochondrial aaa atpase n=1 Tax=Pyrenophora seminiperda CCB06 TaxID=1302712 RepID=A0A3M7MA46_9PLEO|nr:mitochondrial aaa atpase [Pyrenophora seminiperda CCB06]
MENNLSAARAARRYLDERLRNDWAYPDVPAPWSASDEEVRDAAHFQERYYGESESGESDTGDEDAVEYKFDSPDAIGDAVARARDARRRRRKERLEQEMKENDGLKLWVERRDAWTGAASVKKYGTQRQSNRPSSAAGYSSEEHPMTPTGSESHSIASATPDTFDLVPVAPRLLGQNPIRASIKPKVYPDIFQKIVVSSRTPSVPINLADMIKALVQGWKESDAWPPRPGLVDPLAGKKRSIPSATSSGHHGGFIARHPHLEKSVDGMKRILHLSGHHEQGQEQNNEHTKNTKEG